MPPPTQCSDSELVIRTLYEIAGEYDLGFAHQIRRILQLGLRRFALDIGILSRVHNQTYTVIAQESPPDIPLDDGAEFCLGDTYCSVALAATGPVGFEHVAHSDICSHPAYAHFGLEAYIGIPVQVKDRVYGTLNFSSPAPRPRAFSEVDIEALRLLAAWVGSELSRRQTEEELKTAKAMLEQQSREDPLTGLHNRRGLEDILLRLSRRSAHQSSPLVGLVVDVDDFKNINDTLGHAIGDKALRSIAQTLSDSARPSDVCARVGGDEFIVLLPDCGLDMARDIAERMRTAVGRLHVYTPESTLNPSVSIGIFRLPDGVRNVTDALAASGPALQRAKACGKNAVATDDAPPRPGGS